MPTYIDPDTGDKFTSDDDLSPDELSQLFSAKPPNNNGKVKPEEDPQKPEFYGNSEPKLVTPYKDRAASERMFENATGSRPIMEAGFGPGGMGSETALDLLPMLYKFGEDRINAAKEAYNDKGPIDTFTGEPQNGQISRLLSAGIHGTPVVGNILEQFQNDDIAGGFGSILGLALPKMLGATEKGAGYIKKNRAGSIFNADQRIIADAEQMGLNFIDPKSELGSTVGPFTTRRGFRENLQGLKEKIGPEVNASNQKFYNAANKKTIRATGREAEAKNIRGIQDVTEQNPRGGQYVGDDPLLKAHEKELGELESFFSKQSSNPNANKLQFDKNGNPVMTPSHTSRRVNAPVENFDSLRRKAQNTAAKSKIYKLSDNNASAMAEAKAATAAGANAELEPLAESLGVPEYKQNKTRFHDASQALDLVEAGMGGNKDFNLEVAGQSMGRATYNPAYALSRGVGGALGHAFTTPGLNMGIARNAASVERLAKLGMAPAKAAQIAAMLGMLDDENKKSSVPLMPSH